MREVAGVVRSASTIVSVRVQPRSLGVHHRLDQSKRATPWSADPTSATRRRRRRRVVASTRGRTCPKRSAAPRPRLPATSIRAETRDSPPRRPGGDAPSRAPSPRPSRQAPSATAKYISELATRVGVLSRTGWPRRTQPPLDGLRRRRATVSSARPGRSDRPTASSTGLSRPREDAGPKPTSSTGPGHHPRRERTGAIGKWTVRTAARHSAAVQVSWLGRHRGHGPSSVGAEASNSFSNWQSRPLAHARWWVVPPVCRSARPEIRNATVMLVTTSDWEMTLLRMRAGCDMSRSLSSAASRTDPRSGHHAEHRSGAVRRTAADEGRRPRSTCSNARGLRTPLVRWSRAQRSRSRSGHGARPSWTERAAARGPSSASLPGRGEHRRYCSSSRTVRRAVYSHPGGEVDRRRGGDSGASSTAPWRPLCARSALGRDLGPCTAAPGPADGKP